MDGLYHDTDTRLVEKRIVRELEAEEQKDADDSVEKTIVDRELGKRARTRPREYSEF